MKAFTSASLVGSSKRPSAVGGTSTASNSNQRRAAGSGWSARLPNIWKAPVGARLIYAASRACGGQLIKKSNTLRPHKAAHACTVLRCQAGASSVCSCLTCLQEAQETRQLLEACDAGCDVALQNLGECRADHVQQFLHGLKLGRDLPGDKGVDLVNYLWELCSSTKAGPNKVHNGRHSRFGWLVILQARGEQATQEEQRGGCGPQQPSVQGRQEVANV